MLLTLAPLQAASHTMCQATSDYHLLALQAVTACSTCCWAQRLALSASSYRFVHVIASVWVSGHLQVSPGTSSCRDQTDTCRLLSKMTVVYEHYGLHCCALESLMCDLICQVLHPLHHYAALLYCKAFLQ